MTWTIDKTFEFCYGHRVFTQTTNEEFALNRPPKCRHRHGHECKLQIFLTSNNLNDQGFVTDFCNLGWLKKFIDDTIDHKFIMAYHDPLYSTIDRGLPLVPVYVPQTEHIVGHVFDVSSLDPKTCDYEDSEGHFIVNFVPTSENLCRWMADLVQAKMSKLGVTVSRVDWWETPKSRSSYIV